MHRFARFLAVILGAGILTALTLGLLAPQVDAVLAAHTADPVDIDLDPLAQRSIVLDANGDILAGLHREENRKVIPLKDVPAVVIATVLAVEDDDFYEHGGVNVKSIIRAAFKNVESGEVDQGGSTITQQLVKNALLDPEQKFSRKIKEAVLAVRLEGQLSKREILERYLNTVYLGNGAYGVQAAAEVYFGKDAQELNQADAALLAGLINNPLRHDPYAHPKAAAERRAEVVGRLQAVGLVDDVGAAGILFTPLPTEKHSVLPKPNDYFVNEVIQRLLKDERLGETQKQRYNLLFRGGLTIKTTLDPKLQKDAIDAVAATMPDTDGRFTASVVSIDPSSGAVRALVGGEGFERSKYNIATQGIGRQVGSSMKPIVLATALDQGISPKSTINGGGPCKFDNPSDLENPVYEVENFEGSRGGTATLYDQTKRSVNCAYVRLGLVVGNDNVVDMAHKLGITSELAPYLSLPLGTVEIRPIDMASAYATISAEGVYHQPYFVSEVLDRRGKVLFRQEPVTRRALRTETAREVIDVMKGTVTSGTGTAARFRDRRPAAGKTGTTADYGDAWFVGYTKQLSTAVWIGSPVDRQQVVIGGRKVTGGSYPARIWQAFMGPAHEGLPILDWEKPEHVEKGTRLVVPGEKPVKRRYRPRTTTTLPGGTTPPTVVDTTPSTEAPPTTEAPPPTEAPATGQTEGGA